MPGRAVAIHEHLIKELIDLRSSSGCAMVAASASTDWIRSLDLGLQIDLARSDVLTMRECDLG